MNGFATGLSTAITKDGQTTITANLPMAGFRHTGVGAGVAGNDYATVAQVQGQGGAFVAAASVGGTADAITLTPSPAITNYTAGQRFSFVAEGTNTTAVTVATSGLPTRAVTKEGATALVAGDILSGALVTIQDDGTRYQLVAVNGVATQQGANTFTGVNTFSAQVRWAKGADVASDTALTLTTDGNYFDITGTTAITSIGTLGVGTVVKLHFDDVLTLTHHSTDLVLPGGDDIATAAGDEAEFVEYATGDWRCTNYQKASGKPVVELWDQISSGTLSGAGNLDILFIGYRIVEVYLTDFLPSTDGAQIQLRTSTDGGGSFAQGASDYAWTRTQFNTVATFVEGTGDPADDSILFGTIQGNQAGETAAYKIIIFDPTTAARQIIKIEGASHDQTGNFNEVKASGENITAADVDAIRIDYTTGNIASGRYRAIGLRE